MRRGASLRLDPKLLDDGPPFHRIGLHQSGERLRCPQRRDLTAGSSRLSAAAALSLSMMSLGVPWCPLGREKFERVRVGKRRQQRLGKRRSVGSEFQTTVACHRKGFQAATELPPRANAS
jgi:hypothetical protein